jgi:hypothetical protein
MPSFLSCGSATLTLLVLMINIVITISILGRLAARRFIRDRPCSTASAETAPQAATCWRNSGQQWQPPLDRSPPSLPTSSSVNAGLSQIAKCLLHSVH